MTPAERGPVEVSADATVIELHAILACMNAERAQLHPHTAMQVHIDCLIGECVAKTVAWGELVRRGETIPDSSESIGIKAASPHESGEVSWLNR